MSLATTLDSATLRAVFQALPGAHLLLSADLRIEEVSDAYLADTLTTRAQLLGRLVFEVFPDNPQAPEAHAVRNLRASLLQVLATGQAQAMAVQPYDVPDPEHPGQFVARYWQPHNTPVRDADGQVRYLLHTVVNVTAQVQAEAALRASHHRAQRAQEQASQLVRATLDSSPALIQVFEAVRDAAGRIVDFRWTLVNERAAASYAVDLVGQRLLALNPGVVAAGIFARFVQVVESGEAQTYEQEYRHEQYNGWFEQSVVRLGDGLVSTTTDITSRKQADEALRQSEEQFRLFVTASSDTLYKMSPDWRQMLNLEGMNFLADTTNPSTTWIDEYIPAQDRPQVLATIEEAIAAKTVFELEHRVVRADGTLGWTFSRAVPVLDAAGNVVEWFGAATDITWRKQAEEQLRANIAQLQRTNNDLDTFVYTASHDLKAPITTIEGILLALHDHLPPAAQQDALVAQLLEMLQATVTRFRTTITQLTDISKLQQVHAGPAEAVPLAAVVEAVRLDLAPDLEAAPTELRVEVAPEVVVSFAPANLRSVVYNLLSNAVKYRAPGRPSVVRVHAAPAGAAVVLTVQDNGLGLSELQQRQLFGLFQRLHTHVEGTGVGLYIIKRLVENAGGTITVQSQPDVGTTFTVTLPADTPPPASS
jgi:signal transduction histidine kinase